MIFIVNSTSGPDAGR